MVFLDQGIHTPFGQQFKLKKKKNSWPSKGGLYPRLTTTAGESHRQYAQGYTFLGKDQSLHQAGL
jgi:hypothetical protein